MSKGSGSPRTGKSARELAAQRNRNKAIASQGKTEALADAKKQLQARAEAEAKKAAEAKKKAAEAKKAADAASPEAFGKKMAARLKSKLKEQYDVESVHDKGNGEVVVEITRKTYGDGYSRFITARANGEVEDEINNHSTFMSSKQLMKSLSADDSIRIALDSFYKSVKDKKSKGRLSINIWYD